MKKIFNHSIIGSAKRGKDDILFESIEEIETHYSGIEWEGIDFLKCELFTPKEDKIIGYVLGKISFSNSLVFIAVYEFEKNSFTLKQEIDTPIAKLQKLLEHEFSPATISKAFEMCEHQKIGYLNAYTFCCVIQGLTPYTITHCDPIIREKNENYINKYFEIMKT